MPDPACPGAPINIIGAPRRRGALVILGSLPSPLATARAWGQGTELDAPMEQMLKCYLLASADGLPLPVCLPLSVDSSILRFAWLFHCYPAYRLLTLAGVLGNMIDKDTTFD